MVLSVTIASRSASVSGSVWFIVVVRLGRPHSINERLKLGQTAKRRLIGSESFWSHFWAQLLGFADLACLLPA